MYESFLGAAVLFFLNKFVFLFCWALTGDKLRELFRDGALFFGAILFLPTDIALLIFFPLGSIDPSSCSN